MVIERRRQPKQHLQQPVHAGRVKKIAPAHYVGDGLRGIVHHYRQVIARRRILAR